MESNDNKPEKTEVLESQSYEEISRQAPEGETGDKALDRTVSEEQIAEADLSPKNVLNIIKNSSAEIVLRRSLLAELPLIVGFVMVFVLMIYLSIRYPGSMLAGSIGHFVVTLPILLLIPLTMFMVLVFRLYNQKYIVGKEYVMSISGLFEFKRLTVHIRYDKMQAVEVAETIFQRMLNVGDIRISALLLDQPELCLKGIQNPTFYRMVLENLILRAHGGTPSDDKPIEKQPNENNSGQ